MPKATMRSVTLPLTLDDSLYMKQNLLTASGPDGEPVATLENLYSSGLAVRVHGSKRRWRIELEDLLRAVLTLDEQYEEPADAKSPAPA
jgi:hypothetical protein